METHADASLSADMPAASRPPIQPTPGLTAQVSVTFSLVHGTSGGSNLTNLKQHRTQFDALTAQTSSPPNTPAAHPLHSGRHCLLRDDTGVGAAGCFKNRMDGPGLCDFESCFLFLLK